MDSATFLRTLADKIENKELSENELRTVSEFHMCYMLRECISSENGEEVKVLKESENDFSENEMMRFFALGWYIYSFILVD